MKNCGSLLVLLLCLSEVGAQGETVLTMEQRLTRLEARMSTAASLLDQNQQDAAEDREKMEEMAAKLSASEEKVSDLQSRLNASENQLLELKRESEDQQKVAFSAGLGGSEDVGPFSSDTTLVYKNIHTNIGNAYNASTGYFRAPIRGVYFFRFTAGNRDSSEAVFIYMYKNNQPLIANIGYNNQGYALEYVSNAVILEMEQGDTVDMRIPGSIPGGSFRLYDNRENHCTFSGFMLYSM